MDGDPLWSPMVTWETVVVLSRTFDTPEQAARFVHDVADARPLRMVPIGDREAAIALDAYARFGKGRHPARLNMGDCFAYACARANNARLLYKGDVFSHTDLA